MGSDGRPRSLDAGLRFATAFGSRFLLPETSTTAVTTIPMFRLDLRLSIAALRSTCHPGCGLREPGHQVLEQQYRRWRRNHGRRGAGGAPGGLHAARDAGAERQGADARVPGPDAHLRREVERRVRRRRRRRRRSTIPGRSSRCPTAASSSPRGRAGCGIVSATGQVGEPIAGVPAVAAGGQGGLLDVALGPTFAQRPHDLLDLLRAARRRQRDGDRARRALGRRHAARPRARHLPRAADVQRHAALRLAHRVRAGRDALRHRSATARTRRCARTRSGSTATSAR